MIRVLTGNRRTDIFQTVGFFFFYKPKDRAEFYDVPHENRDANHRINQSEELSPKSDGNNIAIA